MTARVDQLRRFARLGLKWNPFRVVAPQEKPDTYVADLFESNGLASQVATSDAAFTQIIAKAGHGKSTFLAAVADELDEADIPFERHYLEPSLRTRVASPDASIRVLLLDEAERLTHRNLRRLSRWTGEGGRLVVSSHRDLSGIVTGQTETVELPGLTTTALQRLFGARLRWAGSDDRAFEMTSDGADWLLESGAGNLRVVESVLYELFQEMAERAASQSTAEAIPQKVSTIDAQQLEWLRVFARRRAAEEASGDVPFSRLRLLARSVRETTDRTVAWFSGRASTPGPAERELPR